MNLIRLILSSWTKGLNDFCKESKNTTFFLWMIPAAMAAYGAVSGALKNRATNSANDAAAAQASLINRYSPLTGKSVNPPTPQPSSATGDILGGALQGGFQGLTLGQSIDNQPMYKQLMEKLIGSASSGDTEGAAKTANVMHKVKKNMDTTTKAIQDAQAIMSNSAANPAASVTNQFMPQQAGFSSLRDNPNQWGF